MITLEELSQQLERHLGIDFETIIADVHAARIKTGDYGIIVYNQTLILALLCNIADKLEETNIWINQKY